MKTIGKQLKPVILLLLALVMLFTAGASAVYAADTAEQATAVAPPDNTGAGENTTGWLDITYGKNGVTLTITPDIAEIKGITKDEIKSLVKTLIEAAKTVVTEDLKGEYLDSASLSETQIAKTVLDKYLNDFFADSTDGMKDFLLVFLPNKALEQEIFADYVLDDILKLESAIQIGAVSKSDIPTPEKASELISNYVKEYLQGYVDDAVNNGETADEFCQSQFNMTYAELLASIEGFKADFTAKYAAIYNSTKTLSVKDFLKMVTSIEIGKQGEALIPLYSETSVSNSAIKDLIKTLPTPTEIADMSADKMFLSYDFKLVTSLGTSEFNATIKVDPSAYDYVHRAATLIRDHVEFSIGEDGSYNLDVDMPALFTKAVLKACQTDKIPEELKDKVFALLSDNVDEAYTFFTNLQYSEIITLLEAIDFESILTKEEIAKYVDLSALTNEQIVEKVKEYEAHFNTLKDYIASLYAKVPASVKDKDLFGLYDGNGNFSLALDVESFNAETYIESLVARYDAELAKYLVTVLNLESVSFKANISVSFTDIYSVEFYAPGAADAYRKGFLPAGADLATFANLAEVNGKTVLGFVDAASGDFVTEMPAGDVKLEALVVESVVSPEDVNADYDSAVKHILKAGVVGNYDLDALADISLSYQWYKNGVAIAGATSAELALANPEDSGEYYCEITVKTALAEEKFTSEKATVLIRARIDVDTDDITLDNTTFTYDGTEKTVTTLYTKEGVIITVTGNKATAAGPYTATVKLELADKVSTALYVNGTKYSEGEYSIDLSWTIEKAAISIDDIGLALNNNTFTYNNTEHTVTLVWNNQYLTFTLEGDTKATNAGNYTATAKLTAVDANYKLVDKDGAEIAVGTGFDLAWTIEKARIEITVGELIGAQGLVYNGWEQYVSFDVLYDDTLVDVVVVDNAKTDAGNYTAKLTASLKDSQNYYLVVNGNTEDDGVFEKTADWSIEKFRINYRALTIVRQTKRRAFIISSVYDGTLQTYVIDPSDIPDGASVLDVVYENNAQMNVGAYIMTAHISISDAHQNNYVLVDEFDNEIPYHTSVSHNYAYEITPRILSAADIMTYLELAENKFIYDGASKVPVLKDNALPAGFVIDSFLPGEGTSAGNYTAFVVVRLTDPENNRFIDENGNIIVGSKTYTLTWSIEKKEICIEDLIIALKNNSFIYNGNTVYVELENIPYYIDFELNGVTKATNAGNYTAIAKFVGINPNYKLVYVNGNEVVPGREFLLDWTIEKAKAEVSVDALTNKDGFVYDGRNYEVSFGSVSYPDSVKVEISGNVAKNAGKYNAKIVFTLKDADNYELIVNGDVQSGASFELTEEWEIAKAIIDFSGAYLGTAATLVADGTLKEYTVMGLPAGTVTEAYTVQYYNRATGEILSGAPTEKGIYTAFAVVVIPAAENYEGAVLELECDFEIKALPKTLSLTDSSGKTIVEVTAKNGVPDGYELSSVDISSRYDTVEFGPSFDVKYKNKVAKIYVAYDISFVDENGDRRAVDGPFTVKIRLPETVKNNTNLTALYINEDGVAEEEFDFNIENGYAVFETTHFSAYAVGEAVDVPAEDEGGFPWWILLVVALIIAIIVVFVLILKKKSKNEPTDGAEAEITSEEEAVEDVPAEEEIEETVEEAPAEEEAPVEDVVVEEAPAEEAAVEEALAEEEAVEETPAQEAVVEEAPAKEETPEVIIAIAPEKQGDEDEAIGQRIINGEVVLVSYRSSYMSRLIQADAEIQDYYTVIKNTLLSYKGVKSRTSWNFESFNKGRIQCAKINLKGRALLVYIGLNPEEYNINKYHFVDVSDKPKFEKVPMLMKVKSDRGLKYVLELIEEMMLKNEIPQGEMPTEDYHMPYETTEELVKRDLVKVILPPGVTLEEGANIQSVDVGELIENANAEAAEAAAAEEAPAEEAVVEEAPAEEAVVEEAPAEEAVVEEAPAEEAVVEEAPAEEAVVEEASAEEAVVEEASAEEAVVEEAPAEEAVVEEASAEEAVVEEAPAEEAVVEEASAEEAVVEEEIHADATKADELLTDDEAAAKIEVIERTTLVKSTKMAEINLDTICDNYDDGETVELAGLQAKRLVTKNAGRLKVLARGVMTKRLTVVADKFSLQAVKMITLAGGTAEQLK